MEEERRLCYVGMTRSEKRLFLTSARYRRRFGGGQQEATIPSRFLREVPRTLVEDLSQARPGIRNAPRKWISSPSNTKFANAPSATSTPARPSTQSRTSSSFSMNAERHLFLRQPLATSHSH